MLSSGCTKIDQRQVNLEIPSGIIEINKTELDDVLKKLGEMAEIYGEKALVMVDKINDTTGTAEHTKAEIPYDVTEMTISALNSMGKNVLFIPYRPDIIANLKNLGYSNFENKLIPSAIIIGGITEFDRGLETKEDSSNLGYETDTFGQETPVGIEYMQGEKKSTAKIAIDYNMLDMNTMSGCPEIQTSNSMQVHKGIGKQELGFTIFGPTLGLKGEVKKVEGRHAALRILIQASIIQLIGKYLNIPYWKLIDGAEPDSTVEKYVKRRWVYQMDSIEKIIKIQELLYLHGYSNVALTGKIDKETEVAVKLFSEKMNCSSRIDYEFYSNLYYSLLVDNSTINRRYNLTKKTYKQQKK